jgi:hypothetical protein
MMIASPTTRSRSERRGGHEKTSGSLRIGEHPTGGHRLSTCARFALGHLRCVAPGRRTSRLGGLTKSQTPGRTTAVPSFVSPQLLSRARAISPTASVHSMSARAGKQPCWACQRGRAFRNRFGGDALHARARARRGACRCGSVTRTVTAKPALLSRHDGNPPGSPTAAERDGNPLICRALGMLCADRSYAGIAGSDRQEVGFV